MKRILTVFGISFALSLLICFFIDQHRLSDLLEKLIFNAVSVLVGLSIAVIGIFLSSINTIYLSIYKIVKTKDTEVFTEKDINKIKSKLSKIVKELKENAMFSLYTFIIVLLLYFFKDINIPHIKWFIDGPYITKELCLNILVIWGNFLIYWSIIDSMKTVFRITNAFELIKED
jgi:hypothetical protein